MLLMMKCTFNLNTNHLVKHYSFSKLLLFTLTIVIFSLIACDKEEEIVPMEPEAYEYVLDLSSPDQQLIFDTRIANNNAIADHDADLVASIYRDTFFILTSTNGLFTGREVVRAIYQSVFDSREEVIFVRTPIEITVNNDWNMASENGKWTGSWIVDGEMIEVGGDYYAKWHKVPEGWRLRCEVYTQFDCMGDVVCDNKPPL